MSYFTSPKTDAYTPSQELPLHLDHKPVFALPYEHFDGLYADTTDVQFISVGIAQYDPYDISIKTMRHTGTKWTRQAEELPLHRPIDMCLFLAKAIFDSQADVVTIPGGTLQNQTSTIEIRPEERTPGERKSYDAAVTKHAPVLKERLNALRNVLNDLKAGGKI